MTLSLVVITIPLGFLTLWPTPFRLSYWISKYRFYLPNIPLSLLSRTPPTLVDLVIV